MMRLFGAIALAVAVAVLMAIWLRVNQTSTLPPNQPAPSLTPEASATKSVVSPEAKWNEPTKDSSCVSQDGLPDVACTPGATISTNTADVVCDRDFKTGTVRNSRTTSTQKQRVYAMYGIVHPTRNTGANQVCEIDHLVAIELGGDDTMANLWPECSPGYSDWQGFGFRDKDNFENWLWNQVCVQRTMTLEVAQTEIARNWVKFWDAAGRPVCHNRLKCD
jgi:hypothetical protein